MTNSPLHVLLADDDEDDRDFFQEALKELPGSIQLTTVKDGDELMHRLHNRKHCLPDLLFLDLNMPRKTGRQCLTEISLDPELQSLPVIVLSTSLNKQEIDDLYAVGAWHYIQKPHAYGQLSQILEQVFLLSEGKIRQQPAKADFVLFPKSYFKRGYK